MFKSGLLIALAALSPAVVAVAADAPRGAAVPWTTYEAEQGTINGKLLGPAFDGQTPAREASGRQCVRIADTRQFVEIHAQADAQGIVVRYSIPDSADGRGADATISLYINGKARAKLPMTSRLSHLYGDYPFSNTPADGKPRNFWDEVRLTPGEIHAGDVIRLQKDADDSASEYLIDLIDLESVPAELAKPADALSVTDFGATADDASDDHAAFIATIAAAKAQKKSVWIPRGQFVIKGTIPVSDVTIRGAGMWYSTLVGVDDYTPADRVAFAGSGSNITLSDFAIVGKLNYRSDREGNDGLGESFGTGSTIRNLWVEHTKAGAWLANSEGLIVENCRFRNTIADGINLCVGMRNTIVRNCTARGTGDDCFAIWPATYAEAKYTPGGNHFVNCTAQAPFLAQGFAIYGGESNAVENCTAIDVPYGAGLFASTTFVTEAGFRGTTRFEHCRLVRTGNREGAIGTVANKIDLVGLRFADIEIIDSPHDAVRFMSVHGQALREATMDGIHIRTAGLAGSGHGVVSADDAVGEVKLSRVTVQDAKSGAFRNVSPTFDIERGEGTADLENATDSKQKAATR